MAVSLTFSTSFSGSGVSVTGSDSATVSAESAQIANPDLPLAPTGTLSPRTNNTSGTLTMDESGHGITTGMRVDLYWDGGQCYGATVGTVSGSTVPIASVAGGDNLPAADTEIYVGVVEEVTLNYAGDDVVAVVASSPTSRAYVVVNDGTYNRLVIYMEAGESYHWHEDIGTDNPLATFDLTTVYVSHGDPNRAVTDVKLVVLAPPA